MSIFDIDFQIQTENLITPTKRKEKNLDFMGGIAENLQYQRDNLLEDCRLGASYPVYNSGTAYIDYDRVQWTDMGIYERNSIDSDGNLVGTTTGIDPTGMPTSGAAWRLIQKNYIGFTERAQYNGQIIILLNAVNKWFGASAPNLIYLVNNNTAGLGFEMYVPLALFNSLGATDPDRQRRFREFTDQYATAGMVYIVFTY